MKERRAVDRIDAIRVELRENGKQMGGLNPKLSIYKKLQERNDELNRELEEIRNNR